MKKPSMGILRIRNNVHGISSGTCNKIPCPLALRYIEGNSIERSDSTNFVSDIINTSIFPISKFTSDGADVSVSDDYAIWMLRFKYFLVIHFNSN